MKVLHPEQATSELALADLRSESTLLSHVDHPNVMRCLFTGTSPEGAPCVRRKTLAEKICSQVEKGLPANTVLPLLKQPSPLPPHPHAARVLPRHVHVRASAKAAHDREAAAASSAARSARPPWSARAAPG